MTIWYKIKNRVRGFTYFFFFLFSYFEFFCCWWWWWCCLLFIVWGFFCRYFSITKMFFRVQNNVFICIAFVVKIFKNEKWAFGLSVMKIDKGSKDKIDHLFSKFANFSEKLAFFTPWYAHVRFCERTKWIVP